MINIVAQLENRFLSEFTNEDAKKLYSYIPERLRQNLLIRKQNCKPYGKRADIIHWGALDNKSLMYVCFGDITATSVALYVMPNPAVTAQEYAWYTEESLRKALAAVTAPLSSLVYQETVTGARKRLCFKKLSWKDAEALLPAIIQWTRKNQNETLSRLPQQQASIAASVGLKEFEMLALVLKTMGGSAPLNEICKKYAALFGFKLTEAITAGVKQALFQYSSDSEQFLGHKDLFKKLEDDIWALR